jgi:hypothetical protein
LRSGFVRGKEGEAGIFMDIPMQPDAATDKASQQKANCQI